MRSLILLLTMLTPLLAQGQKPAVILPSGGEDSQKLASAGVPNYLAGLGVLQNDLLAYFSMDAKAAGGLTWSRVPIGVHCTSEVVQKNEEGRSYLNFAAKKAKVKFDPDLRISGAFTLTAWVFVPVNRLAIIWHGEDSLLLSISKTGLGYYDGGKKKSGGFGGAASPLQGWHHVAIAIGQGKTQAFLDGQPLAVVNGTIDSVLKSVGNRPRKYDEELMASGIDEQLFFTRALSASEVAAVMAFSKPK